MLVATVSALAAAAFYAAASVLQHRAAVAVPAKQRMRLGLMARVVANPWWLLGILADVAAFGFQFVALAHGALVLVQPLLVTGLLFALPLGATMSRRTLTVGEWLAAAAVVLGLGLFLFVASPGPGRNTATGAMWAVTLVAVLLPVGAIVAVAGPPGEAGRQRPRRAVLLAVAGGATVGLASGLIKTVAHVLAGGIGNAFASWEPYGLIAVGLLSLLLVTGAFHAGALRWSLPVITVSETIVGVVIGAVVFDENIASTGGAIAFELAGIGIMIGGVFALCASPLVAMADRPENG